MKTSFTPANKEDYIKHQDPIAQDILNKLDKIIKNKLPNSEETILWKQPVYISDNSRYSIVSYKDHVSFQTKKDLSEEVKNLAKNSGYTTGQKRLNILYEQNVPESLINQIIDEHEK